MALLVRENGSTVECGFPGDLITDFRKQYDKIVSAAASHDKKKVMAAQPMIKGSEFNNFSVNMTTEDLKNEGLCMPPYHFRCRTTEVAYFPQPVDLKREYGIKANKESIEAFTDQEKQAWIDKLQEQAAKNKLPYNPKDLKDDRKHWKEFGVKSETEYIEKCRDVVKNASLIGIKEWNDELQMQFSDGELVVTCDKWSIRNGCKPDEQFKYWFLGQIRRLK